MNKSLRYYKSLLSSWQWRRLRHDKLSSAVLCERCVQNGRTVPRLAVEVHHVVPVMSAAPDRRSMRALCMDPHNLQALCMECHREVHEEMRMHVSKEERKRIRHDQLERFRRKFFDRGA